MKPRWLYGSGPTTVKTILRASAVLRALGFLYGIAAGVVMSRWILGAFPEATGAPASALERGVITAALIGLLAYGMPNIAAWVVLSRHKDHLVRAVLWRWAGHRLDRPWAHRFSSSRPAQWWVRQGPRVLLAASAVAVGIWGRSPTDDWSGLGAGWNATIRALLFVLATGALVAVIVATMCVIVGIAKEVVEDWSPEVDPWESFWRKLFPDPSELLPPSLVKTIVVSPVVALVFLGVALAVGNETFQIAVMVLIGLGAVAVAGRLAIAVGMIDQRYGFLSPLAATICITIVDSRTTPFVMPIMLSVSIAVANLSLSAFTAAHAGTKALLGYRSRAGAHIRHAQLARNVMEDRQRTLQERELRSELRWPWTRPVQSAVLYMFRTKHVDNVVWIPNPPPSRHWYLWQQDCSYRGPETRRPGTTLYVVSIEGPGSLRARMRVLRERQDSAGEVIPGKDQIGFLVIPDYLERIGVEQLQREVIAEWPVTNVRWTGLKPIKTTDRVLRMDLYV